MKDRLQFGLRCCCCLGTEPKMTYMNKYRLKNFFYGYTPNCAMSLISSTHLIIWRTNVWGKVMLHLGLSSSPEIHMSLHFIGIRGCRLKMGSAQNLHGFSLAVPISAVTVTLTSRCFLIIIRSKELIGLAYLNIQFKGLRIKIKL